MAIERTGYELQMRELVALAKAASGLASVELMEAAVRLADANNDVEAGMGLRIELVKTAVNASHTERAIVAFTWCLTQYDKDPQRMQAFRWKLMWYFKWVVEYVYDFVGIEPARIEAIYADMERRYEEWGYSRRAIYHLRTSAMLRMGDLEAAQKWSREWRAQPRDESANCAACEADLLVSCQAAWAGVDEVVKAAGPILSGRMRCAEVPAITHCVLLLPLLKGGRAEEARQYQAASIGKLAQVGSKYLYLANHMKFLSLDGDAKGAFTIFTRHAQPALEMRNDYLRFEFLSGGMVACQALKKAGQGRTRARLPDGVGGKAGAGYDIGAIGEWCRSEARKLAEAFDARNGHRGISEKLAVAERQVEPD